MDDHDLRIERERIAALQAFIDRRQGRKPIGSQMFLCRITDGGNMPCDVGMVYMTNPIFVNSEDAEGDQPTFDVGTEQVPVIVLGHVPSVGDDLVAHSIGGHWVAENPPRLYGCCMPACIPCAIPEKDLTLSWTNTLSGPGSILLTFKPSSGPWESNCDPNNVQYTLQCSNGQIELQAKYWITGSCPGAGTTAYCSNQHPPKSYTLSGPTSGTTKQASQPFMISLIGAEPLSSITVTPSDNGGGGTFTPTIVGLSSCGPSRVVTFTYKAAADGTYTISTTNSGSLTNPPSIEYDASASTQTYRLIGPSSGSPVPPANNFFTVKLLGKTDGTVKITPSDNGGGSFFSPTPVSLSNATPSAQFNYLSTTPGDYTISVTNDGTLINPPDIDFTVEPLNPNTYIITGPSAGPIGAQSDNFTVTLRGPGPYVGTTVITPNDNKAGGTFRPTTVSLSTATRSGTFTYEAPSGGEYTISVKNKNTSVPNQSLPDPPSILYTAARIPDPTYVLSGPTTGPTGAPSTPFTVIAIGVLNKTVTITPSADMIGGTFTPAEVTLTDTGAASFTYQSPSSRTWSVGTDNDIDMPDPSDVSYTTPYAVPFSLATTTATTTCYPFSIKFTLDENSCPALIALGYTSFTVSDSAPVAPWASLCCQLFNISGCTGASLDGTVYVYDHSGGTLLTSGATTSSEVYLTWKCNKPLYLLIGPTSGPTSGKSSAFTITIIGELLDTVIVTLSDSNAGGTFDPPTITLRGTGSSWPFTYTAPNDGAYTISTTNNLSLVDPPPITYMTPVTHPSYTLSGPSSGFVGETSTFTIILEPGHSPVGTYGFFFSDGGAGGIFNPPSLGISGVLNSGTFTYKAASAGAITISTTNNRSLNDPPQATYTALTYDPTFYYVVASVSGHPDYTTTIPLTCSGTTQLKIATLACCPPCEVPETLYLTDGFGTVALTYGVIPGTVTRGWLGTSTGMSTGGGLLVTAVGPPGAKSCACTVGNVTITVTYVLVCSTVSFPPMQFTLTVSWWTLGATNTGGVAACYPGFGTPTYYYMPDGYVQPPTDISNTCPTKLMAQGSGNGTQTTCSPISFTVSSGFATSPAGSSVTITS
jgi:hypothetical protein